MLSDRDRNEHGRPEQARPRDRTGRPLPYDTDVTELVEEHEHDTVEGALANGVRLWGEQRFFEAHECLEDVWHHAPEPDVAFWKAVIQVAVGCVHVQRGNPRGAVTMWTRSADRLEEQPDPHHGIRAAELAAACRAGVYALAAGADVSDVALPDLPTEPGGPWFSPDGGPTPLTREPAWLAATRPRPEA
ncbi:MAG: DUF309 domain-containing protein [Actinomycetes bacterium]